MSSEMGVADSPPPMQPPWMAAITGLGHWKKNKRSRVRAGPGEMDRRNAFPNPSHLLDDAESLLVAGDEAT